jgi:large subunit ribosomal protein L18
LAKRHKRVRNTVEGTPERPRLAVFRSNNHMYAQVIDDVSQSTLVMTSTLSKDIKSGLNGVTNNTEAAAAVGKAVAELCKEKKIEKVCFDRGGFQYHGRVKALADAAREGGLSF